MENELILKVMPHDLEAERCIIGSMVLDATAPEKVFNRLVPESFYLPSHQIIIKIIQDLINKGSAIDLKILYSALNDYNLLDDVGGYTYLLDLAESVPTTANISDYVEIVKEKALRRKLITDNTEIIYNAYDGTKNFLQIIEDAESKIFKIGENNFTSEMVNLSQVAISEFEAISRFLETGISENRAIKTNYGQIDELLNGGLNPTDLIIIAARPAMGKTSYAMNIIENIALKSSLPVAVFSLEMSKEQITNRILSSMTEIPLPVLFAKTLNKEQLDSYIKALNKLQQANIFIDDKGNCTVSEIKAKARRIKAKYKKLGAIVIDYLQLMDSSDDSRVQGLSKITRGLKLLARELDIPVILLSQLSRAVELRQNKRPMLSDLRDSGSIEQDADIVKFLYRDEYYNPDSDKKKVAELIVAKHRNGATGTIELYFDGKFAKFSSLESDR